ncbi:hypothetical protein [Domibacillus mangrovi]|uniref:HK97 gp10 family phage protein n=1 Tax=Domibacillus mangrovi TaxID=1714354 RepID=A0A1Q5P418_9BACI|nr:hypothetical protein [Domibacillus mangrovi]OKL36994.1 hypothetical protein BLL40_05225 [Domibacillus mangrovi]
MPNDSFIRIEWDGLQELERVLENVENNVDGIIKEEYTRYGLLVESGAKALVHQDEGDLEASIHANTASLTGDKVEVIVGSNMVYALRRHEEPYRSGLHDKYDNGAKFPDYYNTGRGVRTRAKPLWRGFQPGRKYLENAIQATAAEFNGTNDRILRRIIGDET